jgi:putative PIN family toxin of toxin-antitoxin system
MRVVVDTNVLVSALWNEASVPARALEGLFARATLVVDRRIVAEYRKTLEKPKLRRISAEAREALLARIEASALCLDTTSAYPGELPDPDDLPFVEVALTARCAMLVTGNLRDFPTTLGFEVVPPAHVLGALGGAY